LPSPTKALVRVRLLSVRLMVSVRSAGTRKNRRNARKNGASISIATPASDARRFGVGADSACRVLGEIFTWILVERMRAVSIQDQYFGAGFKSSRADSVSNIRSACSGSSCPERAAGRNFEAMDCKGPAAPAYQTLGS
jgi:hypothetical protein